MRPDEASTLPLQIIANQHSYYMAAIQHLNDGLNSTGNAEFKLRS